MLRVTWLCQVNRGWPLQLDSSCFPCDKKYHFGTGMSIPRKWHGLRLMIKGFTMFLLGLDENYKTDWSDGCSSSYLAIYLLSHRNALISRLFYGNDALRGGTDFVPSLSSQSYNIYILNHHSPMRGNHLHTLRTATQPSRFIKNKYVLSEIRRYHPRFRFP